MSTYKEAVTQCMIAMANALETWGADFLPELGSAYNNLCQAIQEEAELEAELESRAHADNQFRKYRGPVVFEQEHALRMYEAIRHSCYMLNRVRCSDVVAATHLRQAYRALKDSLLETQSFVVELRLKVEDEVQSAGKPTAIKLTIQAMDSHMAIEAAKKFLTYQIGCGNDSDDDDIYSVANVMKLSEVRGADYVE